MLGLGKALRLAAALFFLPAQAASMPTVSSHQAITTTLAPIDASRSRQNSVDAGEILSSSAALPQATAGSETKAPAISDAQQYTLAVSPLLITVWNCADERFSSTKPTSVRHSCVEPASGRF